MLQKSMGESMFRYVVRYDTDGDLELVICLFLTRLLCVEHIFQDRIAIVTGSLVSKCQDSPIEFSSPKESVSKL